MALTRRTRKRLLFLATILAGAGLVAAGYHLVIVPRRDRLAQNAYQQARQAYEAQDYAGVLKTVGVYLGRNRYDGEALFITADSHFQVALACAAEGNPEGWMKNYRGARDYAMAARAQLGNDQRVLELLLTLHSTFREIAEVEEIARILGDKSERGMEASVRAALWAGNDGIALDCAEKYVEKYPLSFTAQSLRLECMADTGVSMEEVLGKAAEISDAHPERADFAVLFARAAVANAHVAGLSSRPRGSGDKEPVAQALVALERVATAVPEEKSTFAEYLLQADQMLRYRGFADAERRSALRAQRDALVDRLMEHPERREWAAATAAAWAWARSGRTAAVAPYIDRVADIPDEGADESLLGWRGAAAQTEQRRAQIVAALQQSSTAHARVWRHTIQAIGARLADDYTAHQEHLARAEAIAETSATWLPFFEMEVAYSLGRNNDRAGAIRQLREIVDRAPTLVAPRLALYHHLLQEGRSDDALAEAGLIRQLRVDDPESMYLWAVAAISAAEGGAAVDIAPTLVWLRQHAALEQPTAERPAGWEDLATLIARCHFLGEEADAAAGVVQQLIADGAEIQPALLVALLEACKTHGMISLAADLAATMDTHGATPQLLLAQAELTARTEGPAAAEEGLLEEIQNSTGDQRLSARLAYVSFLDRRDDDGAIEAIAALIDEHPDSVLALSHALGSMTIWTDGELVNKALAELKKFGQDETMYRIFNAARFLAFEFDPAGAADHIQEINSVLERDPQNVKALRMMAALLLRTGRGIPSGAIAYTEQAARLGDLEAQFDLVQLLLDAGKPSDARRAAATLRSIPHPVPAILRMRAQTWLNLGLLEEAEKDLAALGEEATPRDVAGRALLLVDNGKPEMARQLIDQLIQRGIDDPDTARHAAGVLAATGDADRGRRLLEELAAEDESPEARLALADYLMAIGSSAEAASLYEQAVLKSEGPELWLRLANCHLRAGEHDRACEALARAPDGDVIAAARALCGRTKREKRDGFTAEILVKWMEALAASSTRDRALVLADSVVAADVLASVDPTGADQNLASFAEANRSFLLGWVELAEHRRARGDSAAAILALRSAVNHIPVDPLPATLLTARLIDADRWDEAAVALREWRNREGESYLLHLYAAFIADQRGDWDVIVELLEPHRQKLAAQVESGGPNTIAMLAAGLAGGGRVAEAHELLWPLVERKLVPADVYAGVAARVGSAMKVDDLQQWTERTEPLLSADDPTLARLRFTLALAQEAAGKTADAERSYRRILESGVAQIRPSAANNLAALLRRERRNLEEAIDLAQSAVDAARSYKDDEAMPMRERRELWAAFLDTLGQCQLAAGRSREAVVTFKEAFSDVPEMLNLRAGLIVALEIAGDAEAEKYRTEGMKRIGQPLEEMLNQLRAEYGVKNAAAARLPEPVSTP